MFLHKSVGLSVRLSAGLCKHNQADPFTIMKSHMLHIGFGGVHVLFLQVIASKTWANVVNSFGDMASRSSFAAVRLVSCYKMLKLCNSLSPNMDTSAESVRIHHQMFTLQLVTSNCQWYMQVSCGVADRMMTKDQTILLQWANVFWVRWDEA